MRRILFSTAVLCLLTASLARAEDLFDIKPMADGVYAAIAKPAYKVNCNAAIIFLGDSVLVVDTHSKPSAARSLIEQIKKITDKPVRYVVNTHFHWDHYQGNQAYPSSSPPGKLRGSYASCPGPGRVACLARPSGDSAAAPACSHIPDRGGLAANAP